MLLLFQMEAFAGIYLGQRTGVGGEDAGKGLLSGQTQYLVLHELHAGDVLLGIELHVCSHHEGVQYFVETSG